MCMQCYVNPYFFYDVIPGWTLIRARREHGEPGDVGRMSVGDWGLLTSNDPSIIWSETPKRVPYWQDTADLRRDAYDEYYTLHPDAPSYNAPIEFEEVLGTLNIIESYSLVKNSIEVGFDLGEGMFHQWLWNYLGNYINTNTPHTERDSFPALNNRYAHDENIGWK